MASQANKIDPSGKPLLVARDLRVTFLVGGKKLYACDGVNIEVRRGETVGVVGESGSGKSTVALTLMRVHKPESGQIIVDDQDIAQLPIEQLKPVRKRMQMVFQDPYGSLDPRWTVRRIVAEPLKAHGYGDRAAIEQRVRELIEQVGLGPDALDRLPSQFSGGQRQRIAIARALALEPEILIADEPVSALDVSIQAQIVNLLQDIQKRLGLAYIVIAHDLALVHQITNRVVVLYLGQVVEEGNTDDVILRPLHPYTVALLSAAPVPEVGGGRNRIVLRGEPPSPLAPPSGCRFHTRCPIAKPRCSAEEPPLAPQSDGRKVACFYPGELAAQSLHKAERAIAAIGSRAGD
jgi:oligopeptide/dipeptide ABC transporter ATP-binding protein